MQGGGSSGSDIGSSILGPEEWWLLCVILLRSSDG